MNEINQKNEDVTFSAEEVQETPKSLSKKGNKVLLVVLVLIVVLVGAVFGAYKTGLLEKVDLGVKKDSSIISTDPSRVVATVNGITITRSELDKKIAQVKKTLPAGAVDPTEDAMFELTLLNDLISLKLLTTAAEAKQYTVTDDQVAAERASLVEQLGGEEILTQQLQSVGINDQELVENMQNELLIRQLLDNETDIKSITVTDEEVQQAYDNVMMQGNIDPAEAPALEEVSDMLKNEVINQKSAVLIQEYIEKLKQDATIEITL